MTEEHPVKLFISHHSSKADVALQVETLLAERGIRCWLAPRDVPPGAQFDTAVHKAIESSTAILLLFCANSDKSRHVKRELILGDSAGRAIIPLRLEEIDPGALAYHLADSQWIDWIDRREAVMDRVAAQARLYAGAAAIASDTTENLGQVPPTKSQLRPAWLALAVLVMAGLIALTWFLASRGADDGAAPLGTVADATQGAAEEASDEALETDGSAPDDTADDPPNGGQAPDPRPTLAQPLPVQTAPIPRPTRTPLPVVTATLAAVPLQRVVSACRGAATDTEYLICADPELGDRARDMGALIRSVRTAYQARGESTATFDTQQRQWMNGVKAACSSAACVETRQISRISALQDLLGTLE